MGRRSYSVQAPLYERYAVGNASTSASSFNGEGTLGISFSKGSAFWWKIIPCLVLIVLPWVPCKRAEWSLNRQKDRFFDLKNKYASIVRQIETTTDDIRALRLESENMARENEKSFQEMRNNGDRVNLDDEQYLQVEQVEEAFVSRIDHIQQHIQERSRKMVIER